MERYTSNDKLTERPTITEKIQRYRHDKNILKTNLKLARLNGNEDEIQAYEEKLKHLKQTRGKNIRKICTRIATLIAVPLIILSSSIAIPVYAHVNNTNEIVEMLEKEQDINLKDENGKIDYDEAALALIRKMVAEKYGIPANQIDFTTRYYDDTRPAGSTALRGGKEWKILIVYNDKSEENGKAICYYYEYSPANGGQKEVLDTFPKGKSSEKILKALKRVAQKRGTINNYRENNSFDLTDLKNENVDNLPPYLPEVHEDR